MSNSRMVFLMIAIAYYGMMMLFFHIGGINRIMLLFLIGGTSALIRFVFSAKIEARQAILKAFNREPDNQRDFQRYLLTRLAILIPIGIIVFIHAVVTKKVAPHSIASEAACLFGFLAIAPAVLPQHLNYAMRRLTNRRLKRAVNDGYNAAITTLVAALVGLTYHPPITLKQPGPILFALVAGGLLFCTIRLGLVWTEHRQGSGR